MPVSKSRGKSAPGQIARRWLYLTHRWIGIASCLLFAMWFGSGLVMLYVPYPSLPAAERAARLEPIAWDRVRAPMPSTADLRSIVLEMRDGSPVWRLTPWEGDRAIRPADGGKLAPVTADMARRTAARYGGPVARLEVVDRDQWTVTKRFDGDRPLWKAVLGDAAGTEVYVSSATGDAIQRTTRTERIWNWLGSVPHWLYFTVIRQDNAVWRQVVMWVAGPCIAAAVTGLWIGILRARFRGRRYKGGRVSPYRGWMLWHHVAGLVGGIFLTAWIFSGWLSVDPGHMFAGEGITDSARRRYAGALIVPEDAMLLRHVRATRVEAVAAVEGHSLLQVSHPDAPRLVLDAVTRRPPRLPEARILRSARHLMPGATLAATERLTAPDAYWYAAGGPPRLPVLRLRFADTAATWVHVDPATGEVLGWIDARGRTYRWLFDLLHKWDLNVLTLHPPLRLMLIWLLSAAGLVTSLSGVVIAWRRLRRSPATARPGGRTAG